MKKTPLVTASGHANFHAGRANVWEAETKRSDIQGDVVKDGEEEGSVPATLRGTRGMKQLKHDGWKTILSFRPIFTGYVSFREGLFQLNSFELIFALPFNHDRSPWNSHVEKFLYNFCNQTQKRKSNSRTRVCEWYFHDKSLNTLAHYLLTMFAPQQGLHWP